MSLDVCCCYYCICCVIRDPADLKRTITSLSWYPGGSNKLAAAYSFLEFQKAPQGISWESYIWEIG